MTPPTVQFIPASGPTLIIHDAFGGTGGLSGRTPDTVDNGNTWTTYNGETYTVGSGHVIASNDTSDFSKSADIDVGTSTYTLKCLYTANGSTSSRCGATIAVSNATDSNETFAKFDRSSGGFRCVEYSSGSALVTNFGSIPTVGNLLIVLDVSGASVNYSVFDSTETTTHISGSHTLSVAATNRCGINSVDSSGRVLDFKVYTPPVVATRKVDWDTYAIAVSDPFTTLGTTWVPATPFLQFTPTGTAFEPQQTRFGSFDLQFRNGNTSSAYGTNVPWVAIWNVTTSVWTVHQHTVDNGTLQGYEDATFDPSGATAPTSGDTIRVVGLSRYSVGDVNTWSDYA